ncbi:MAG: hypothetical protein R2800_11535 [Flavipsychrobacter sp.]
MSDTPTQPAQERPRKEISAEEFIKIWKGEYKGVAGYEEFYQEKHDQEFVVFKGYKVIGELVIEEETLPNIELFNILTSFFCIKYSTIGDCSISDSEVDLFNIYNSETQNINILHSIINGFFFFTSTIGNFNITDSKIGDIITFGSTIGYHLFSNTKFKDIVITSCTTGYLKIIEKAIVRTISIEKSEVPSISLYGEVCITSIELKDLTTQSNIFEMQDSSIRSLYLQLDKPYTVKVKKNEFPTGITILNINESLFTSETYILISDIYINQLRVNSLINNGTIIFNNIKPVKEVLINKNISKTNKEYNHSVHTKSQLSIKNSDLGNTQFIGCDLASFDKFEFKNSKMAQVFLADTSLPHRNKITTTGDANKNEQRHLALSQFKKIYEGQGDMVRAADFRAQEMEVYRSQLKPIKQFGTWLILSFSFLTSNYGNSIWRPLFWLFCVHYLLFMLALGFNAFDFDTLTNTQEITNGYYFLEQKVYAFFYLMSPLRKVYLFKYDWTILIDLMMRVWSSYMIYNFIRASRRFIK